MLKQREIHLANEFAQTRETLKRLDLTAAAEKRSLTDDEQKTYDDGLARMAEIDIEISKPNESGVAAINAGLGIGQSPVAPQLGETLLTMGRAALGGVGVQKYASDVDVLQRVLAHGVAADGTAPVTIEGDLINFVDASRPAISASRRIPMPDNRAPTFKRPRVTQHTTVGTQAAEGDVLSSQRLQLTGDTITKATKGGVLSLSEQEIDWTDPAILGLAIQDLADSYAIDTDDAHTTAIETALTASVQTVLSLTAAPEVFIAAIAAGAGKVYASSKTLPDTLFLAVDRWQYVTSLTDADGRPLFSTVGAQNAAGAVPGVTQFVGNVLGLNVVVDPNFTAGVWGVAASKYVEHYEQNKGLLSVNAPSTLEVVYAYRGYVASNVRVEGVSAFEVA